MFTGVGNGDQPLTNACISRGGVQYQPSLAKRGGKRHNKAVLEVMVEAFDLALSLGAVGTANFRRKGILLSQLHQLWVPAMLAGPVDITLNNDGLGVVEQQLMRSSAKELKCRLNAVTPGCGLLVAVELDESRPAPAQRSDEGQQRVMALPDDGEINLHLYAGFGLKARDRLSNGLLHGV